MKYVKDLWNRVYVSMVNQYGEEPKSTIKKIYCFIGAWCAYALTYTSVTPNQVTFFGLGTGILASFMFLKQEPFYLVISAFLVQITLLTDYIDGILARHKKCASKLGQWMDANIDRFTDVILIFGITLGLYFKTNNVDVFILGFIAVSARLLINLTHYIFEKMIPQGQEIILKEEKKGLLKEIFYTRAFIYFFMSLFALLNNMKLYLILLAIYGSITWVGMVFYFGYRIKKMIAKGMLR